MLVTSTLVWDRTVCMCYVDIKAVALHRLGRPHANERLQLSPHHLICVLCEFDAVHFVSIYLFRRLALCSCRCMRQKVFQVMSVVCAAQCQNNAPASGVCELSLSSPMQEPFDVCLLLKRKQTHFRALSFFIPSNKH